MVRVSTWSTTVKGQASRPPISRREDKAHLLMSLLGKGEVKAESRA